MLIDRFLPEFEFREFHEIRVNTRPEVIYKALFTSSLASDAVVRSLLFIRSIPARLLGSAPKSPRESLTLRGAERFGFYVLGENPPTEVVILLQGKFWTPGGGLECASREALSRPLPAGMARAAWNFSIRSDGAAFSVLSTETRIHCADAGARLRFRIYWTLVRPGSGLIRRIMLRSIRDAAEQSI